MFFGDVFQVNVGQNEFPALDATIAHVTDRVTAVPARMELSLRGSGSRLMPVTFSNSSDAVVDIHLAPGSVDDAAFDWLRIRPDRFRLEPGHERKALVLLGANRDIESHRYAAVVATATTPDGEPLGDCRFPVALVGRNPAGPELVVSSIEYDPNAERPAFIVSVENRGSLHLPLMGELVLTAEHGKPLRAVGGHGRWLMPGNTDRIRFPLPALPESGLYELQLRVQTGNPDEPFEFSQVLEIR